MENKEDRDSQSNFIYWEIWNGEERQEQEIAEQIIRTATSQAEQDEIAEQIDLNGEDTEHKPKRKIKIHSR